MDEIISEFLIESYEAVDTLDGALVELERSPSERATLERVFREIHTIKGTAGMLGFSRLEQLTHAAENLLDAARSGQLELTRPVISALLGAVDVTRAMLMAIEESGQDASVPHEDARAQLQRVLLDEAQGAPAPPPPEEAPAAPEPAPAVERSPAPEAPRQEPGASVQAGGVTRQTLRVSVDLLEALMNLVGELVLARNQILQFSKRETDRDFLATTQRLNLITSELQESVMKARMQPIQTIWNRLPRLVRDTATSCGKRARLEMEGAETELDKTLIEAIADPLVHIVRNAVDHGIEPPEERRRAGKPAEGCLRLRAFHEDGQVNLEVRDDGAGIDAERLRQRALERNLITAQQAGQMSHHELLELVFAPGLSTAAAVTNVSGRGVGMDVVKTNIERLGGTVEVRSQRGEGTTLRIKIPLTLAIIPALIVTCQGARYAIPQVSLLELVRLDEAHIERDVETIHDTPVYRLRGKLLPLVFLKEQLALGGAAGERLDSLHVIVLQAGGQPFGLVVDEIIDTEEIVMKPLSQQLNDIPVYAGATIMGDGRVALILDVPGLARASRVLVEEGARALAEEPGADQADDLQRLLLFEIAGGARMVMPLSAVARLEEFCETRLERAGPRPVVQYRDEILELLFLSRLLPGVCAPEPAPGCAPQTLHVVVYQGADHSSVGIVVDRILDVVEAPLEVQRPGRRHGVAGSIILRDRVTEVLDVEELIEAHCPAPARRAHGGEAPWAR